jgi:hypothetical protein
MTDDDLPTRLRGVADAAAPGLTDAELDAIETAADRLDGDDPLLAAIADGNVHDQLLGYMNGDESAEATLGRLLRALPSFASQECVACGRSFETLADADWLAWRLRVDDTDRRRTDLYCGPSCLADSLDAHFEIPVTEEGQR